MLTTNAAVDLKPCGSGSLRTKAAMMVISHGASAGTVDERSFPTFSRLCQVPSLATSGGQEPPRILEKSTTSIH
jgi:hypothetical protein